MLPLIERIGGPERVREMMARAGLFTVPSGLEMIPEGDAARLHRQLRLEEPELAPRLAREAGLRTADYILAHRIPKPAQLILKALPAWAAARLLAKAIEKHAWTFVGSGQFRAASPWCFEIIDNPLRRGERTGTQLCDWHAAVFERLYRVLVHRACRCTETHCVSAGDPLCRFEITRAV